jgi:high affinity sulfate transporter 1
LRPADLPREISAGITLAALVIPLNIGYAQVAGLPATLGLYAAIVPLVLFALFTSSPHVVGGPGPATAALVAAALAGFAAPGDPLRVQFALVLALVCSLLFFLAWYFRLGFLENFLSRAVLVGFVSGLGIQVLTNQVRKIMGVSVDTSQQLEKLTSQVEKTLGISLKTQGYFLEVSALVKEIPNANLYPVAIGVGSLVIVRLLKRYAPKVPGALVALVLMTVVVAVFNLDQRGVSVLGKLPSGLPALTFPTAPPTDYIKLLPGALALVAITLCEGLLLVRTYANKHGYKADRDQVLFAYGLANLGAGLTGSMVTGNSVSRSAAMDSAGARSQLPSLVAAGVVAAVLAFFTDLLALVPNAALAGIVANAVLSLIGVHDLRTLFRLRRSEFWIATVCLLAVLGLGPLRAVLIAFLLSIIDLVTRASRPYTTLMRQAPGGDHFVPGDEADELASPGLIVYLFSAPLFFANANVFSEEIQRQVKRAPTPVKWFVLDAHAMMEMDITGAEAMRQVLDLMKDAGVTFALSRAPARLVSRLKTYGLLEQIGSNRLYATNREAAAAYYQDQG